MSIDNTDIEKEYPIVVCKDIEKIVDFLWEIEPYLPESLAARVDFHEYAEKVVVNGYALAILEGEKIISLIMFYCNDITNKIAYFTFAGTSMDYRKKGLSLSLFNEAIKVSSEHGMRYVNARPYIVNKKILSLFRKLGFTMKSIHGKTIIVEKVL